MPKPGYEYYVGIDYGTSTCKLAYASPAIRAGGDPVVKNFPFSRRGTESSPRFPSGVVFDGSNGKKKSRVMVGHEGERLMMDERRSRAGDFEYVHSPKMDLGEGVVYPFAPIEYSEPADLCALTLEAMVKEFERTLRLKRSQCRFLITVPSSFSSRQREDLLSAVARVGIDAQEDALVDEPNAAFLGLIGQPLFYNLLRRERKGHVLLIDFGAGTCDMSVLQVRDDPTNDPYGVEITNLAINDFAQLGGNDIDKEMATQIADYLKQQKEKIDALEAFDTLSRFVSKVALATKSAKEQLISFGRAASRSSSSDDRIDLRMLRESGLNIRARSIPYAPRQFRQVMDRILGRDEGRRGGSARRSVTFLSLLDNVLSKAGLEEIDIGSIVLAGGSSKVFQEGYFRSFFNEKFPHLSESQIMSADDPDLLISRGAALECLYSFHERRSIIQPICPGEVGVRTAEGEYVALLPSGTALPYPNQEDPRYERNLYVPTPRPATMRVPIAVKRFGEWKTVETWEVNLPEEFEPNETLVFSCAMAADKILKVRFTSKRDPSSEFQTTCTRWLHGKEPTSREVRIAQMRNQLKAQARAGLPIPPGNLVALVRQEYLSGMYDIVRRRCQYLLEKNREEFTREQLAELWNYLGLVNARQSNPAGALYDYEKAAELNPADWAYNFNVGATYLWRFHNTGKALSTLRTSTECDRPGAAAWYWYGVALEQCGDVTGSRGCFNRVLDILSRSFTPNGRDDLKQIFRDVCDRLEKEYPDLLREALNQPNPIDPDDTQPSLIGTGNVVCATPSEA